ncbi:hypothetical protein AN644_02260 [Candidatus Epulonipiscium fishelsonii]|nr:hypothetical protein AN644_02260 [Epulopiscium sp. SCG-C06WGA-EpuloA1]
MLSFLVISIIGTLLLTSKDEKLLDNFNNINITPEIQEEQSNISVILPSNYEENVYKSYPTIYLFPDDGLNKHNENNIELINEIMNSKNGIEAIIVELNFENGEDFRLATSTAIDYVDKNYRTIAEPAYRAGLGAEIGGYMAYITALTSLDNSGNYVSIDEPKLFKSVGSINGNFTSEDNLWRNSGDVLSIITEIGAENIQNFYTYIDGATESSYTYAKNSTNDIGSLLIEYSKYAPYEQYPNYMQYGGIPYEVHEFTSRNGEYDDEFLKTSIDRVINRFSEEFTDQLVSGDFSISPQAVKAGETVITVDYSININTETYYKHSSEKDISFKVVAEVMDPISLEVLDSSDIEYTLSDTNGVFGTLTVKNLVNGVNSKVNLYIEMLGMNYEIGSQDLIRIQETTLEHIDLMGDWHFNAYKPYENKDVVELDSMGILAKSNWKKWDTVSPALGWWTDDFHSTLENNANWTGYAWYIREFKVPEQFTEEQTLLLSLGKLDEADEVYINGTRVGYTGIEKAGGEYNGSNPWDKERLYEFDVSILHRGDNVISVRMCNSSGGGGWYAGPIGIYSKSEYDEQVKTLVDSTRFYEETYPSKFAASALGLEEDSTDMNYRIYLPKGYNHSDKRYPVVYLLHQLNSTSKSYEIDEVQLELDEGINLGEIDEMIVVMPDSSNDSFWKNDWEKMVTEELIPHINKNYRTIVDPRFTGTAGCSMGGFGAYNIALNNPELFSSVISFYGAVNSGEISIVDMIENLPVAYLGYFDHYFICGNQDMYGFAMPAIDIDQRLREAEVEHKFLIENGAHDNLFYKPYLIDAFSYASDNFSIISNEIINVIDGTLSASIDENIKINYTLNVNDEINKYLNIIPNSNPESPEPFIQPLTIPVLLKIEQNGKTVYTMNDISKKVSEPTSWNVQVNLLPDTPETSDINFDEPIKITLIATMINQNKEIGTITVSKN